MKIRLVSVVIACAAVLAGCGSSGGDSPPPPDNSISATIDGAITKGIVVNGVVVAEELDSSANVVAAVGNAVTGNDGSYNLTLHDYKGGVIQITITADATTQMKCDVPAGCGTRTDDITDADSTIDFGEFYKPVALTMTALIPAAEDGATINASVTPFTHMAAERAKAATTFDSAAVASANSEVSNLLGGVDILNTRPVDITDSTAVSNANSPTQVTYAALMTVVASEAGKDANGQPLLNDALNLLAASFTSGTLLTDDTTGDDSAQISLQEIVSAADDVLTQIGVVDTTGVLAGLQQEIDDATGGYVDPVPGPGAGDANLDKVKAMVSDMRTWGNVILNETQAAGSAFQTEVDLASQAVKVLNDNPFDAFGQGLDAAIAFDNSSGADITAYNSNFSSGIISSPSTGVVEISNGVVGDYTVNMTITLPDDGATSDQFDLGLSSTTVSSTSSTFSVTSGVAHVTFVSPYTIDYAALMGGVAVNAPKVSDVTLDIDASFTQNKDSSGVDLPSPVSFIGTIMTDLDPIDITNNPGDYLVLPKTLTLTGQISDTQGNSMTETLAVNVTNTDTFNFVGEYAIGTYYSAIHSGQNLFSWSYSDTNADTVNDTFAFHNAGRLITIHWDSATNTADMSTPNTSASAGMISSLTDAINYFFFNYGIFDNIYFTGPNSASVWASEGVYNADQLLSADMTIDGSVDGYLTSPEFVIENATQWIEANIGLTFDLQLTGLPLASVNINADRTAFEEGKGAITIGYGNRQIAITVDGFNISNSTASGSVKITNQDGVVVNLDNVTVSDGTRNMQGTLSYNGNQYGVIERTASSYIKVTYTDGTFEIF